MHRFLVATELLAQDEPVMPREAAQHLKVVRPKDGEELELFDGKGRWRTYRFAASPSPAALRATAPAALLPRPRPLTLFACVTKGSRWDWTIEKATELGTTRIVPVISDRTIVRLPADERAAKAVRWRRIAEDAARQSDAKWLPTIVEPVDFGEALALVRETDCFVGALVTPPAPPLAEAVLASAKTNGGGGRKSAGPAVFVGPEGDFTPEELAALLQVATPTSFGPTILRAETAAIFALSVLSALKSDALTIF